jgi:hypothetical protein
MRDHDNQDVRYHDPWMQVVCACFACTISNTMHDAWFMKEREPVKKENQLKKRVKKEN